MVKEDLIKQIKPLQWRGKQDRVIACSIIGRFWINAWDGYCEHGLDGSSDLYKHSPDLGAAKQACQQHYEQTILSLFNLTE